MSNQSILLIIFSLGILLFHLSCVDPVEKECNFACQKFIRCAQENSQKSLSATEVEFGRIQCVQGCTMVQGEIIRCYQEAGDSCEGFKNCIIQSGVLE